MRAERRTRGKSDNVVCWTPHSPRKSVSHGSTTADGGGRAKFSVLVTQQYGANDCCSYRAHSCRLLLLIVFSSHWSNCHNSKTTELDKPRKSYLKAVFETRSEAYANMGNGATINTLAYTNSSIDWCVFATIGIVMNRWRWSISCGWMTIGWADGVETSKRNKTANACKCGCQQHIVADVEKNQRNAQQIRHGISISIEQNYIGLLTYFAMLAIFENFSPNCHRSSSITLSSGWQIGTIPCGGGDSYEGSGSIKRKR